MQHQIKNILLTIVGVGLITLSAQLAVPLPGVEVPITGQTFGVLLVGVVLGRWWGSLSVALYVLLGALGLPLFAGGTGGWDILTGSTGGFLLSFPVSAWLVGWATTRVDSQKFPFPLLVWGLGHGVILLIGFIWIACLKASFEWVEPLLLKLGPGTLMKTMFGGFLTQVIALKWRLPLSEKK